MIKYFGNVGVALGTEVIRGIVLKEMPKGETSKQIIVLAKEKALHLQLIYYGK